MKTTEDTTLLAHKRAVDARRRADAIKRAEAEARKVAAAPFAMMARAK